MRHVVPAGTHAAGAPPRSGPLGAAGAAPSARRSATLTRRRPLRVPGGEDGFTLVELLVVVAVLVTLVGIAIPTFARQQDSAWDAAVRAQLRAGTIALASYQAQNATYAADALDPELGWGYELSPEVVAFWDGFGPTTFCGRAWRRTGDSAEEQVTATIADERAQFIALPDGVFPASERSCS